MNNKSSASVRGGIGFCGLLTIAFVVLRLCGVIRWRWIWVLAPAWISVLVFILVAIFVTAMEISGGKKR